MASNWIKMRTDLADDPAVIGMAARLGMDADHIVGKLHNLWSWANEQTVDGHAAGVTGKWVDKRVGVKGFADAMKDAGWLFVTDDGIEFPRFDKHNGESAKARAQGAKRQESSRSRNGAGVTSVTHPSRKSNADSVTETRQQRYQIREDKRREEHNSSNNTPEGHHAPAANRPDAAVAAAGVLILTADQQRRYETLFTRPLWLPEDKPWIDASTARRLALMPTTTDELIANVLRDARAARKTLANPAGLVIKNLSRPDPDLVAAIAAREAAGKEAA